ncbi:MAG: hypothetical protein MUC96_14705 [Myxococcaceae bacterium]|jgi:hypothetical protein|nr:hypothetical protein [Myxococcaceae bacterium]
MTTRMTWALGALLLGACGVDSSVAVDDGVLVETFEGADVVEQDVRADVLNVVPMAELDLAPGSVSGRIARVFTTAASARAFFGPVLPSVSFTRNWLLAYRPEGKSPRSRVEVTRAQLSSTGKTLTLWATLTEPGAGCQAWRPNEVSVVRVPSRVTPPSSVRVFLTRATADCGLTVGPTCVPQSASTCPQATPFCLGSYQRADGSFTQGTCVKFARYDNSSSACADDAACGAGGICAGLSTGGGLCQPAWMRGTYSMPESGQLSATLPRDGSWHRLVVPVSGQATVPMDAWVQLFLDGASAQAVSNVRFRVFNPSGTESSTVVASGLRGALTPVFVPGDESVNGEWVVEVKDTSTAGPPVRLQGVRLSVTSRWD